MLLRIITSVLALPIIIGIVIIAEIPLKLTILCISAIGMLEFYKAMSKNYKLIHLVGLIFAVIYIFTSSSLHFNANVFVSMFVLSILLLIVIFHKQYNIIDAIVTFFGFFYICFLLYFIYLVRIQNYGQFYVWLIFISAWGCDTGAYLVGITIGKRKLIPNLSPNKTLEGSIGGIIFVMILTLIYGIAVYKLFGINNIACFVLISTVAAIFAQLGDLVASSAKRFTGIKDYGYIVFGHGGILDRFDSVLFTAPVVYCLIIYSQSPQA